MFSATETGDLEIFGRAVFVGTGDQRFCAPHEEQRMLHSDGVVHQSRAGALA